MKDYTKKQRILIILGLAVFILIGSGLTYAALTWATSSPINIGLTSGCFEINYTPGGAINNANVEVMNESTLISNNKFTITEGIALTYANIGIKSTCTIEGYGSLYLNVTSLSSAFTTGSSKGSLKYAILNNTSSSTTLTVAGLKGQSFDIVKKGIITSTGLKNDTTRNMIAETTYYIRGHDSSSIYVDAMYDKERVSGTVIAGVTPTRTLTWTGKVALAYSSDYGYAADLSLCQENLYGYDNSTCTANNWMNNILGTSSYEWLLTPDSGSANQAMYVTSSGYVDIDMDDYASDAFGVVPVLSLTSELGIGSGSGTSSNPYQLNV